MKEDEYGIEQEIKVMRPRKYWKSTLVYLTS